MINIIKKTPGTETPCFRQSHSSTWKVLSESDHLELERNDQISHNTTIAEMHINTILSSELMGGR